MITALAICVSVLAVFYHKGAMEMHKDRIAQLENENGRLKGRIEQHDKEQAKKAGYPAVHYNKTFVCLN